MASFISENYINNNENYIGNCLILGDGDFTFSKEFIANCHTSTNIITSTLETYDDVIKKKNSKESLAELSNKPNVKVLFETDATKLQTYEQINQLKFGVIVFNFPHVGGKSNIGANRRLIKEFFHSAAQVLKNPGVIEVALCGGQGGTPADKIQRHYNDTWKVVELAAESELILTNIKQFPCNSYSNYNPTGFKSRDQKFNTNNSLIHSFISHPDSYDTPSLDLLLKWKYLIPDLPYPVFQMGEYLIPFEILHRYNRKLWKNPKHPIGKFFSLIAQQLTQFSNDNGYSIKYLADSPIIINSLDLNTELIPQLDMNSIYKCYKLAGLVNSTNHIGYSLNPSLLTNLHHITTVPNTIYVLAGDVYRRSNISNIMQPVTNEVMLVNTSIHISLRNNIIDIMIKLFPLWDTAKLVWVNKCGKEILYFKDICILEFLLVKNPIQKIETYEIVMFKLDALCSLFYNIQDVRILWTHSELVLQQLALIANEICTTYLRPINLYPYRAEHDMCFWHPVGRVISELEIATVIRCTCRDYPTVVELFNEFICPLNRLSHNYRLVLQSCDFCLSRSKAHRLQSLARELLRDFYNVELR